MNPQAEQIKGFVDELVALVRGTSKEIARAQETVAEEASIHPHPRHTEIYKTLPVGLADKAEERVRSKEVAVHKAREKAVKDDEVIPMDETEFKDF